MQSNAAYAPKNYPPLHYHHTYDVESAIPAKIIRASSSDKCSAILPSSPTEEHFHSHQPKPQFHMQQPQLESGEGSSHLEHKRPSHYFKKGNEILSQPCPYKSYKSSFFGIQSSDRHQPKHFHHQSQHKEPPSNASFTAPSLTLDLIQHATGNRLLSNDPHLHSSKPICGQELTLESVNASTRKPVIAQRRSTNTNMRIESKSNRNSSGSNIIPPPHDFESDKELEKVLCIDSGLDFGDRYKLNEIHIKCQDQDAIINPTSTNIQTEINTVAR